MLLRISIVLIVLLLLPAWCVDRWALRRRVANRWRIAAALPGVLLAAAVILTAAMESYSPEADRWKGTLLTMVLCVAVPETISALLLGVAALLRKISARAGRVAATLSAVTGVTLFVMMLYGFTIGWKRLTTHTYTYASETLPAAFDGYRIVQLSDLHLGTYHGRGHMVDSIVAHVNALHPDLIVFTGDLVNYHADEVSEFLPVLRRLQARDGVVSVMGNHDYAQYYRHASPADSMADIHRLHELERAAGWHLLLNEHVILRRGDDSIAVIGVENEGHPPFPARADLPAARRGIAAGTFSVLLSHDPTHWRKAVAERTDIALTLAGHTHGMQFSIGGFSPAAWFYDEWGGAYSRPSGQTLYVSLGTGQVLMPFRLGAWPEITLITLKKS